MASNTRASTTNGAHGSAAPKTFYEQQREMLLTEIAQSLEHVLHNMNRLNRSLEEVIQVGNEFAPVESLWSHFEGVMGPREGEGEGEAEAETEEGHDEGRSEVEGESA